MILLEKFIMLLMASMFVFYCIYAIINRILEFIERHMEYKYRYQGDTERLSGADFDGDQVVVIPTCSRKSRGGKTNE